jgi:hypothetical protein
MPIILDLHLKFLLRKRLESCSMLQLFSYLLHLVQPFAYHACHDALHSASFSGHSDPGDVRGVFIL